jgi:hypothetical protein
MRLRAALRGGKLVTGGPWVGKEVAMGRKSKERLAKKKFKWA